MLEEVPFTFVSQENKEFLLISEHVCTLSFRKDLSCCLHHFGQKSQQNFLSVDMYPISHSLGRPSLQEVQHESEQDTP